MACPACPGTPQLAAAPSVPTRVSGVLQRVGMCPPAVGAVFGVSPRLADQEVLDYSVYEHGEWPSLRLDRDIHPDPQPRVMLNRDLLAIRGPTTRPTNQPLSDHCPTSDIRTSRSAVAHRGSGRSWTDRQGLVV